MSFLIALSCLAVPTIVHGKSKKDDSARERAAQLLKTAVAVSNIHAADSEPFALSGVIEQEEQGFSANGSYSLIWAAPNRWREEIHFANYSRVRVGGKDSYWQLRSIDYEPLAIFRLTVAFGYLRELRYAAQPDSIAGLQKINFKDEKIAGLKAECARLTHDYTIGEGRSKTKLKGTTTYCFNLSNGSLASLAGWLPISEPASAYEYSNFVAFGGKVVPSTIVVLQNTTPRVVFHMNQIVPLGKVDPEIFVAPAGAQEWDSCLEALSTEELLAQKPPDYPSEAYAAHITGNVFVYAVVGTDGQLHNEKVLSSPSPLLSSSVRDALRSARYRPPLCKGQPAATESILTFTFGLPD